MVNLAVITPYKVVCATTVDHVILPAFDGQLGITERHFNVTVGLEIGLVKIKLDNKWTPILVFGGIAAMKRNQVTILAEYLEEFTNVDEMNEADLRKELEETISEFQIVKSPKERMDLVLKLREQTARLNGVYLLKNNKK